jgi:predicted amidohydrolase YtcJ
LTIAHVDLAFINGKVITFDHDEKVAEAVAISGNKIVYVGRSDEVRKLSDARTNMIDLNGKVLLPGFIDAHTHFIQMGSMFDMVDLRGATSLPEALERVKQRVAKTRKGEFIIGINWDESKWPEKRYINKKDLDIITTLHPVALIRIDGHMMSVNSYLLKLIKIPREKRGMNVDEKGEPTGILKEEAAEYVRSMAPSDPETLLNSLEKAINYAHELGVTSVHDTVGSAEISAYVSAHRVGKLKIRVYLNFTQEYLDYVLKLGISTGFGDDELRIGALKLFSDGSIGSRTAAISGEFADEPGNNGMLIYGEGKLEEIVASAHRGGIQVAVHAIGDRAIDLALNAIERALKALPKKDHRHRIEHMELAKEESISRVAKLGVVASMQPNFIGEWGLPGDMYEKRLGRYWLEHNNVYRKLMGEGVVIAFGSDCMPFSPLYGIHWAVNAPMKSQRISVQEAIKCYTINAAYASFEEKIKGSIEPGKLADLVALSANPYENPQQIDRIKVALTVQGGEIVYRAQ